MYTYKVYRMIVNHFAFFDYYPNVLKDTSYSNRDSLVSLLDYDDNYIYIGETKDSWIYAVTKHYLDPGRIEYTKEEEPQFLFDLSYRKELSLLDKVAIDGEFYSIKMTAVTENGEDLIIIDYPLNIYDIASSQKANLLKKERFEAIKKAKAEFDAKLQLKSSDFSNPVDSESEREEPDAPQKEVKVSQNKPFTYQEEPDNRSWWQKLWNPR